MHSELLRAIISECRHYQQETSDEATNLSKETLIFALVDLTDRVDFPMSDAICAEIIGRSNVLYCGRPLPCLQHSKKDCLSQAEGAESMSIPCRFSTAKEAKEAGWFSRRHQTSEQHLSEQKRRKEKADKKKAGAPQFKAKLFLARKREPRA